MCACALNLHCHIYYVSCNCAAMTDVAPTPVDATQHNDPSPPTTNATGAWSAEQWSASGWHSDARDDGSQPSVAHSQLSYTHLHALRHGKPFRLQCVANSKYITSGDTATHGDEPTFEDLQPDSLNQLWVYDETDWTLTAVENKMTLCVVKEGGMKKVIMQGDTNNRTWFEFKDDGTIRCKHGYIDGNVKTGAKRKIMADILCWKHHGKSNQQWNREAPQLWTPLVCERPPVLDMTSLQ